MSRRGRPSALAGMVILMGVMLSVTAWAVAIESPLFNVRHVRVQGNARLSAGEILGLVGPVRGRNLLTLPLGEVRRNLLSSPWVADVGVERSLPSTLILRVEERRPAAWVRGRGSGAVVATDGTILQHRRRRARGLVSLGRVETLPEPGTRLRASTDPLRVVASLPPAVRRRVARAGDDDRRTVTLRLREGGVVVYGKAEALDRKNATLLSMLRWVEERELAVDYIDVRAPDTPVLKPLSS